MTADKRPWVLEEAATGGLHSGWIVVSRHLSMVDAERAKAQRIRTLGYKTQAQLSGLRVKYQALA